MAPFIARSQRKILRAGFLLMGSAGLIGLLCTYWLTRSLSRLRHYAKKVTSGERVELALRGKSELAELGRAIETMRLRLEDKQYVERYVSTLTHELKSPLAAIRGAAELLEEPMPEHDRSRFAKNIRNQAERLHRLIQELLSLAAVEQRLALKETTMIDLVTLVDKLRLELEPKASLRRVTIQLAAESAVLWINGDRLLLEQAVRNLVDNALDYAPQGTAIVLRVSATTDMASIEIMDSGPGIPTYALPRVFERFYSLPKTDQEKGTGLGLCLVKEVAALHHGQVTLDNRPEGGARAVLLLPLGDVLRYPRAT